MEENKTIIISVEEYNALRDICLRARIAIGIIKSGNREYMSDYQMTLDLVRQVLGEEAEE